ncbi:hypothetical protein BJF80_15420 [Serinicoccus sp. CUA-874]|uniref:C40 family peptidase n=1 Tax=Serinicoccus sp. CUA-874 TaxID=1517939 RepID=UPI000960F492|nr:C40 family peptidase [Serinicoccus sp. CUA-874]OLT18389.1 hypothetical protein BJF80_15420 [Serinicoccus sp. CUA-874]
MTLSTRRLSRTMIAVTAATAPVVSLAPAAHAAPSGTPQLPQQPLLPATPTTPVATPRVLPTPAPTSTVTMTVNAAAGVNARSGPSTSYGIVGGYRNGAKLTGTLTSNNWLKVGNNTFVAAWNLTRSSGSNPGGGGGGGGSAERVTQWMEASVGNVRSGPGLGNPVVTTMRKGTKVMGTWTSNGWLNIGGGKYIAGSILTGTNPGGGGGGGEQPDPAPNEVTRWVSAASANVRSGPSTSYSVVGSMSRGTEVTGTLTSNGWLKMSGSQYMAGSVLTASNPGGGGGGGGGAEPAPAPAPSTTRQEILDTAAQYIGTPYKWGGNSPQEGFDCSGYTKYVFAEVGLTLPRTAAMQQAATTPVSNPQPGDLVFHGSPAYHVGIYAGDGMMYDTGRPGVPTQYRAIFSGVSGYGRVDGVG